MSKILKSTTLGNVKNGGIFKALGKKFVKLDADEHGCLVLATRSVPTICAGAML